MNTGVPGVAEASYIWKVEGLDLRVVLAKEALAGLRFVLQSGAAANLSETGGILLGHTETDASGSRTYVESFDTFALADPYGSSYTHGARDIRLLDRRLNFLARRAREGQIPVGLWRTHARKGLYLDQRDFEVFQRFFAQPTGVFLLTRQDGEGAARGGVFVWENEDMRRHASYLEFPLEALEEESPVVAPAATVPNVSAADVSAADVSAADANAADVSAADVSGVEAESPRRWLLSMLGWVALRPAVLVALGLALPVLGFYAGRAAALSHYRKMPAARAPRIQSAAKPETGPDIVPPPVQPAPTASETSSPQTSSPQTSSPQTSSPQTSSPQTSSPQASSPQTSPPQTSPVDAGTAGSRDRLAGTHPAGSRRLIPDPAPVSASRAPAPHLPDPPAAAPRAASATLPAVVKTGPPSPPQRLRAEGVTAYIKPAPSSGVWHSFGKVFHSHDDDDFTPATPMAHPLPALPAEEISAGQSTVELLARIDRSGSVAHVRYSDGNNRLSGVSSKALSQWRFEPARRNGSPVESDMLVRFEFRKRP